MTTTVKAIEVGHASDAWLSCSNGSTYYEPMYCWDIEVGDEIDTEDYEEIM